jgi:hypothetical protein
MIQHKVVHLCVHYHPAQIRTVGNRKVHRQKITEKVICHFGDQSASSISATNHRRRRKFCIRHNLTQSHLGTYYWSSNTSINRDPKRLAPLILSMTVRLLWLCRPWSCTSLMSTLLQFRFYDRMDEEQVRSDGEVREVRCSNPSAWRSVP